METKKTFKAIQVFADSTVKVVDQELLPVSDDEVQIRVEAGPINPTDLYSIRRNLIKAPSPYQVGSEGSGTIAEVGKMLTSRFKIGDKVAFIGNYTTVGSWAQYTTVKGDNVFHIHHDNTFEEAATHCINPITLMLMLREVQKEGHKAVIHSIGASALGKMMIRLFKEHGIKTINLVRRDDVKDELLKLGADYVLNLKAADFEKQFGEIAQKENATKLYDGIVDEQTVKLLGLMPPSSILTLYGLLSGKSEVPLTLVDILVGGRTINSFAWSTPWAMLSLEEKIKLSDETQKLLKTTLKSEVIKTFPLDQFNEAITYSEANASKGKVLIKPWN